MTISQWLSVVVSCLLWADIGLIIKGALCLLELRIYMQTCYAAALEKQMTDMQTDGQTQKFVMYISRCYKVKRKLCNVFILF